MRKSHPAIITAICLFTVVMFVTKRYFVTKQKRWFCLSALTAGVMLIATQQYGIYAALVLVIYILAHCIKAKFSLMEILKKGITVDCCIYRKYFVRVVTYSSFIKNVFGVRFFTDDL